MTTKNIAIFASGEGTNAQRIIDVFKNSAQARVVLVLSNKASANVLNRAKAAGIEIALLTKHNFYTTNDTIQLLKSKKIDLIVLAGFLWMVPEQLIQAFPEKIINIHPALLPAYGGKGMYGMHVHEAVIAAKEKQSGITVHFVNERYDEGKIISQHRCTVLATDTPEQLAEKIHQLEHEFFPKAIQAIL